jgi:hypothetical protein
MFDILNQFSEFVRVLVVVVKRIWPDICGIPAQNLIANDGVLLEETLRKAFMPEKGLGFGWEQLRGCVDENSFKKLFEVGGFSVEGIHAQQVVDIVPFGLKGINTDQGLSIVTLKDLGFSSVTGLELVFHRAENMALFTCDLRNFREIIMLCYKNNLCDVLITLSVVGTFRFAKKGGRFFLSDYQESVQDGLKVVNPDQKMIFMTVVH